MLFAKSLLVIAFLVVLSCLKCLSMKWASRDVLDRWLIEAGVERRVGRDIWTSEASCSADTIESLNNLFNSTNGKTWLNNTGWGGSSQACCSWYGIECRGTVPSVALVTDIRLADNNLTGPIPEGFAQGVSLQKSLVILNISSNRIKTLPENIGLLTKLAVLDVGENTGSLNLPASLGNTSMVYLRVGNGTQHPPYEGVQLVEVPASLSSLKKLKVLDLNHNSLDGTLDAGFLDMPQLEVLDLGLGNVDVVFPGTGFSGVPKLRHLNMDYNNIYDIPDNLGDLRQLEYLSVQAMPGVFGGSIPDSIGQLESLRHLTFAQNYNLKGPVPASIWNLTNLQYMDISYNGAHGTWPDTFEHHDKLMYLEMGDMLYGHLPEILGQLTSLVHFGIRTNQLQGPLPKSLGNLTKLKFFNVAGNSLNGTIPESYKSFLPNVKGYNCQMDSNDFACPIPDFVPANCGAKCS